MQKTYTIDFLTKKRVKNNGYVKKYYVRNSHEAIISKEQYYQVQEELKRRSSIKESAIRKRYSSSYPLRLWTKTLSRQLNKLFRIKLSNHNMFESFIATIFTYG